MMKSIKIFGICLALAAGITSLTSCEKWFDVHPKTQVAATDMFTSEGGFIDVLTGVYIQMVDTAMYGRDLTFGMVDCIGKVYSSGGTRAFNDFLAHKYDGRYSKPIVEAAWQKTFAAIANLNILIEELEKADRTMFEEANYHCIYGEALGLRAFLHFDMLRLYAPAFSVGPDAAAIPYVDEFSYEVTPSSTVREAAALILKDLETAAGMLGKWDPVRGGTVTAWMTRQSRVFHMNYYAVKATQARVYHWIDEPTEAAKCAREVIESRRYKWTSVDDIANNNEDYRDRTFSTEQIFAIRVGKIDDIIHNVLDYTYEDGTSWPNRLVQSSAWRNTVMPATGDWRRIYFYTQNFPNSSTDERYNNKYYQSEEMRDSLKQRLPLIRLPEMHLIVAQCDPSSAVEAMNEIHSNRGIGPDIPATITPSDLAAEINMEYLREFVCEGVVFYNWKRQNSAQMTGPNGTMTGIVQKAYVLPMPDEEKQFGGREEEQEDE